jgi:hypothetical protein
VVGAHDLVADDGSYRERGAAVDAKVTERVNRSSAVAPDNEELPKKLRAVGSGGHVARISDPVPTGSKSLHP